MAERRNSSESEKKNISFDEEQKKAILDMVADSERPTAEVLRELGISRSTYYSWLNRFKEQGTSGLVDKRVSQEDEGTTSSEAPSMEEPSGPAEAAAEETGGGSQPAAPEPQQPVGQAVQRQENKKEVSGVSAAGYESGGGSKKTNVSLVTTIAIIFIIAGLVFSLCMFNSSKYYVVQDGTKITLWKGKFSLFGKEQVPDFAPIDIGSLKINPLPTQTFFGEWGAVNSLFEYLLGRADDVLSKPEGPDYGEANNYLNVAEKVAFRGEQRTSLNKRYSRLYETIATRKVVQTERQLALMYEDSIDILERAWMLDLQGNEALEREIHVLQAKLNELRKWNVDYTDSWLARKSDMEALLQPSAKQAKAAPAVTPAAPQAKAEEKPLAKVGMKPEAMVETKPEMKNEMKPEAKPAVKPEAKLETKPEEKATPTAMKAVERPQAKATEVLPAKVPTEAAEKALEQVQAPLLEPIVNQPVAVK